MSSALVLIFALSSLLCDSVVQARLGQEDRKLEELRRHRKLVSAEAGKHVKGQYIIGFEPLLVEDVQAQVKALTDEDDDDDADRKVMYTFDTVMKGCAMKDVSVNMLEKLLRDPNVKYIEEDQIVEAYFEQDSASWGLDYIDGEDDGVYEYEYDGQGVEIYIVDTGIRSTHDEFDGRVECSFNVIETESCEDLQGHGTHVAGIAAGRRYGVAKAASIKTVKVLDSKGRGYISGIIAGLNHIEQQKLDNPSQPMVANLSLGTRYSPALNEAANDAIQAGVVLVVAAGNSNDDACKYSPASVPGAITTGSVDRDNRRSSFSSWGRCLDIFAPGSGIVSAYNRSNRSAARLSGTSMASPFVAGAAALYLQRLRILTPGIVSSIIRSSANSGIIYRRTGSPNKILHTGSLTAPTTVTAGAVVP